MSIVLFDISNPEHQKALENACANAFKKCREEGLLNAEPVQIKDVRWTTEDLCRHFNVKPPAIYKYIREFSLPYTKGKPNLFWKSEVLAWEEKRKRIVRIPRKSNNQYSI